MPAFPNWPESAMLKQPACAAAISSSGFVPTPFSKRVEKEYWVSFRTPLAVETVPFPSIKPPAHRALAVRTMSLLSCGFTSEFRELHAPEPAHIQCTTPDTL